MNFYKKLIPNKNVRFKLLSMLRFVPDKPMIRFQYRMKLGRKLNLKDPQRYMDKLQWMKLYYRDPLMQKCADKYSVKDYVRSKGLGHILNEEYAVFQTPEEIDLDKLPDSFVLKLTNGSGTNLFCTDKSKLDLPKVIEEFRHFYIQSGSSAGREWVYRGHKPVIIAEKVLHDPISFTGTPRDYKIFCFGGKAQFIICVDGRKTDKYCHVVYDTQWNKQDVRIEDPFRDVDYERPEGLEDMVRMAEILAGEFPAVRVDFYHIEGQIIFGEMTFFPWSGYMKFRPDEFDFRLGKYFVLPPRNH